MFSIQGQDVAVVREALCGVNIVKSPRDMNVRKLRRGALRLLIQYRDSITHPAAFNREHARELAAAEDANGSAGQNTRHSVS